MRRLAAFLIAFPAAAAPLPQGDPRLQVRVEGLFGQPTNALPVRGGAGLGVGWRLTDQFWIVGDIGQRAAPNGGIGSIAAGLQATFDMTPISPFFELAVIRMTNQEVTGFSLATRTGLGADWAFRKNLAVGIVVRTYTPIDPSANSTTLAGLEAAIRLVFTPGAH